MDLKKIALLVVVAFLAYKYVYRAPEVDYGQYTGAEERAPRLRGKEVLGHMLIYMSQRSYSAGHGFVLSHESQKYVVTASHVVRRLKDVDSVDVVSGDSPVVSDAKPAFGPSYSTCNMDDARRDVTFYTASSAPAGGDITLAPAPPKAGQNVWLFCTQDGKAEKKILMPAQVTSSSNRALKYKFLSPVSFNGTSGCPVINSNKQLVGVNVCGHSTAGVAVPVPTILDGLDSI